ncbi:Multidrug resistance protein ABC transporter [Phytophthora cinnamomi]|uniref:Multidrug resistance protein ABC transporter n=1 Tax=Phytophthora cinnamomi TaxID=4785 RepID=UPI003559C7B9|nr:Multidrug resistance protein ABC transporter [Phytophthora cinnamomi]
MTIVFKKKELVDVVDGAVTRDMLTSAEAEADFDDKQLTIMQLIGMSLPADIFHQVRDKTTGTDMWKAFLPHQYEFESLKSGVRYNSADNFITPERTRELIRVADSRQKAYQVAKGGRRGGPKISGNGGEGNKARTEEGQQHGSKTKDSKKKRVNKCYICDSTEHLRNDCPQKAKGSKGGRADAAEQKRKPRANMTTRREDNESGGSPSEDEEANEATSLLDTPA